MIGLFQWLFSVDNFMPHGHCFLWEPSTLWLNVGSDGLIAISYFAIPLTIYHFTRRRKAEIHYRWVMMMFAAFIFLCGATHVMGMLTVWNPVYRVAGAVKLLTGLVSLATAISLIWIMPRALLLKTPRQLAAQVQLRTQELAQSNEQLRAHIAARDTAERHLRLAEQERARADVLLQTIVESAPSLIYAKDRGGRMLLANPPVLKLIGKSWAEVKGRTDREFLADPSQAERVIRNDLQLMDNNEPEHFEEAVGLDERGEARMWFSIKAPLRDGDGKATGLVGVSVEITEQKRLEQRLRLMVHELNHRVKNTLATVQAIATQTLRGANQDLYLGFQGRLKALAAAHDVLTRERWSGADLGELAAGQLAPVGGPMGTRVVLSGPPLRLSAQAGLALAMGMHELAVNALKYGALSMDAGRVSIHWEITESTEPPMLRLTWTEQHGPEVRPPARRGFGMRLIEQILAHDLGGVARLDFTDRRGVLCTIETPLARILAPAHVQRFPSIGAAAGEWS